MSISNETVSSGVQSAKASTALLANLVSGLDKILKPVADKLFMVSYLTVGIMSIPIVCDVLARMLFNTSVPGVTEISELSMILIVFFGLSYLEFSNQNIRIDFLYCHFSQSLKHIVDTWIYMISAIIFGIISWQTILQAIKKIGVVTMGLQLPMSFFIAVCSLGSIFLTLTLINVCLKNVIKVLEDRNGIFLIIVFAIGILVATMPLYVASLSFKISGLALGGLGVLLMFILMLLGMPIGYSMATVGFLGLLLVRKNAVAALSMMGIAPYYSAASYVLTVVPLFILMGELALYSGISNDLFDTANKWLGRLPGGLAMSAVAGCAGFAAVCGDSMATAVTMGTVSLPEMKKKNYDPSIATGCLAAGGTLGILIPPSVGFISTLLLQRNP